MSKKMKINSKSCLLLKMKSQNKPSKSQINSSTSLKENPQVLPQTSGAKTNPSVVPVSTKVKGMTLSPATKDGSWYTVSLTK